MNTHSLHTRPILAGYRNYGTTYIINSSLTTHRLHLHHPVKKSPIQYRLLTNWPHCRLEQQLDLNTKHCMVITSNILKLIYLKNLQDYQERLFNRSWENLWSVSCRPDPRRQVRLVNAQVKRVYTRLQLLLQEPELLAHTLKHQSVPNILTLYCNFINYYNYHYYFLKIYKS